MYGTIWPRYCLNCSFPQVIRSYLRSSGDDREGQNLYRIYPDETPATDGNNRKDTRHRDKTESPSLSQKNEAKSRSRYQSRRILLNNGIKFFPCLIYT